MYVSYAHRRIDMEKRRKREERETERGKNENYTRIKQHKQTEKIIIRNKIIILAAGTTQIKTHRHYFERKTTATTATAKLSND